MHKSAVARLTIEALRSCGTEPLPGYESGLNDACVAHPPPFGMAWYGERYRDAAIDPGWLAQSLVANANKESAGSKKLWSLAIRAPDPAVAEQIRQHAVDEAGHARLYTAMLDVAFPDAMDAGERAHLEGLFPRYRRDDRPDPMKSMAANLVLDELIQMNIGEIRTRIHQLLLRPVILAHTGAEKHEALERILAAILADETRHIQYTARLIERAIASGLDHFVRATMNRRLAQFNEITLQEVGLLSFEGA